MDTRLVAAPGKGKLVLALGSWQAVIAIRRSGLSGARLRKGETADVPDQIELGAGAGELAAGGRPEPVGRTIAFTVRSGAQEEALKRQPAAFAALVATAGASVIHGKEGGQGASQFRQHIQLLKRHEAAGLQSRARDGSSNVAAHPVDAG
jgi:hypothetical protein